MRWREDENEHQKQAQKEYSGLAFPCPRHASYLRLEVSKQVPLPVVPVKAKTRLICTSTTTRPQKPRIFNNDVSKRCPAWSAIRVEVRHTQKPQSKRAWHGAVYEIVVLPKKEGGSLTRGGQA